jgi:hypothetical protein
MTLKLDPARQPATPARIDWGEMGEAGSATVLRFATAETEVSFPYHQLRRWELKLGEIEILTILAGDETITVTGRSLCAVRDAIEATALEILRLSPGRKLGAAETHVTAIAFAVEKP